MSVPAAPLAPDVRRTLTVAGRRYDYFSLTALAEADPRVALARLPYCVRVLLENLLRHCDGETVTHQTVLGLARVDGVPTPDEVAYFPSRVLMPDSSGGPLLVDLAAMRDAVAAAGGDPARVNPLIPVDLVIDHSAIAEYTASADAMARNLDLEFDLNRERFGLIRWAQKAFERFRVVPPGNGILHQINLEYLARVVRVEEPHGREAHATGRPLAFPDTLVGMDSHTPMVNGLGVLGWGVGGVEAGSALLGEPITMRVPKVVGCRLSNRLGPGVTATDLVLTLTALLRQHDVVGKFVEFCGEGVAGLSVPDRATVANMAPEYGATMGFFPVDERTLGYLHASGREAAHCELVQAYAKAQRLWRDEMPQFDSMVELDLATVQRSLSGPRRPQDRVALADVPESFVATLDAQHGPRAKIEREQGAADDGAGLADGDVVIAAITSCTNTSNPYLMIGAGILARNAVARGLRPKPWVKTSLSPGSRRVAEYLQRTGLDQSLAALGFQTVGYGCMTCMGSSGSMAPPIERQIREGRRVAAVLSGNRNFEARVHPLVRANYLASPPLVVAYALAGSVLRDLSREPLGEDAQGRPVFLADLWPDDEEIARLSAEAITPDLFTRGYARIQEGPEAWDRMPVAMANTYAWDEESTYIRKPPYVVPEAPPAMLRGARMLALLGDDVTTDHITPVGSTQVDSQVGKYLTARGVRPADFNSLSSRRANPDVVARTTYANVQLRNEMVPGREGDITRHLPSGDVMPVFLAATRYREEGVSLIVVAGRNYGAGSSRDTAAKGVRLLGVRAVIAESFERIHRSNLVALGVLPLEFMPGTTRRTLGLVGDELFDLNADGAGDLRAIRPGSTATLTVHRADGS
ncbi:MAG: aconitate hydratase AcnA, partial [Lautropia sp.]